MWNLEAKPLLKTKRLGDYWINVNTITKCFKLSVAVPPFLITFSSLYMDEVGFTLLSLMLMKERNRLNLEESGE